MLRKSILFSGILLGIFIGFQNCSQTSYLNEESSAATDTGQGSTESEETESEARNKNGSKSLPQSFFAIHFEPRSATAQTFESLQALINEADTYHINLTLQFTPSWAKLILNDSKKESQLRKWQLKGHEVAAHHHGANHGWGCRRIYKFNI